MRFLDANLPPALAEWLRALGHHAEHVFDAHPMGALDKTIWRAAAEADQIVVTRDTDFLHMALADASGPAVVLVRCGNLGLRAFERWFALRYPTMMSALGGGERIVELA